MTNEERADLARAIDEHARERVQRVVVHEGLVEDAKHRAIVSIDPAFCPETKPETQLELVRGAIDYLCSAGDLEPKDHLTSVSTLILRAMTPIRNLEAKLVRQIEADRRSDHVKSSTPTPGMAIR